MQVMCRMTHLSYSPSKVRIKRGYLVGCVVRVYVFQRIGVFLQNILILDRHSDDDCVFYIKFETIFAQNEENEVTLTM